jgi:phage protein D
MGLDDLKYAPVFVIVANKSDITSKIADRLVQMTITDEAGVDADMLEISLADHDPADRIAIPPKGAELEVWLGYGVAATYKGLYVCDEVSLGGYPCYMTIRARAAQFNKSKEGKTDLQTQKSRSWSKGLKLGDIAEKIAKEHGMTAAVAQSLAGIVLPHFDQTEESDINFLVRVTKRYDAIAKPAGGKLVLAKRGEGKTASGDMLPTIALDAKDCTSWSYTEASRESAGTVIAYWHAKKHAKKIEVKLGEGEPVKRLRHFFPDEAAAKAAAQAELDKAERGKRTFNITLSGDPEIGAEFPAKAAGFHPDVDGDWMIKRVVHHFDTSGYKCDVECESVKSSDAE